MAVVKVTVNGESLKSGITEFYGLSKDAKPTKVADGSSFLELDTSKVYIFNEGKWYAL